MLYTFCPKNIQELCKPCCDHVTGLWTVVVCDAHLQGTHMVPLELSLSRKTNLFTSVINIYDAPKSLLFVLCVLGIIPVLGWETALKLHGHGPGKRLQNTTTKRPQDGSSRLHKTNRKALKCKTSWNSFALLVSKNAFSPFSVTSEWCSPAVLQGNNTKAGTGYPAWGFSEFHVLMMQRFSQPSNAAGWIPLSVLEHTKNQRNRVRLTCALIFLQTLRFILCQCWLECHAEAINCKILVVCPAERAEIFTHARWVKFFKCLCSHYHE